MSEKQSADAVSPEAQFEAIQPQLDKLSVAPASVARVDPERIARAMLTSWSMFEAPKLALLDNLPQFDPELARQVPALATVLLYIRQQLRTAEVQETAIQVPLAILDEATSLKNRALQLLSYHLSDSLAVIAEINSIREGTGYVDLGQDLGRLAKLLKDHQAAVAHDTKNFRAGDSARAVELAAIIFKSTNTDLVSPWERRSRAALVLLEKAYNELRRAATFLYHDDPERLAAFAPFVSLGRKPASNGQKDTPPPPAPRPSAPAM